MQREILVCHLGVVPYAAAVEMQLQLRARRQAGELGDLLLLLEHPPTYTVGRRAASEELPLPREFYEAKGIEVNATDRGGRVTYHGPGQLVGYPIMAAPDVIEHLRTMERAIVAALGEAGVPSRGRVEDGPDYTGVWTGAPREDGRHAERQGAERKIASLGVHVSHGISTHGFAVNVENDLEPFDWVVACGLPDVRMTSVAEETRGEGERLACFRKRMAFAFCEAHGARQRLVTASRLGIGSVRTEPALLAGPVRPAVPAHPMAGQT